MRKVYKIHAIATFAMRKERNAPFPLREGRGNEMKCSSTELECTCNKSARAAHSASPTCDIYLPTSRCMERVYIYKYVVMQCIAAIHNLRVTLNSRHCVAVPFSRGSQIGHQEHKSTTTCISASFFTHQEPFWCR